MAIDQSGTKPPFATPGGRPADVSESGTPRDLVKDPNGGQPTTGDQRNVIVDRRQSADGPKQPPTPPWLANRPQQAPGTPAQRVAPESVPEGGTFPDVPTKQPSAGTGSIGNARRPFKV